MSADHARKVRRLRVLTGRLNRMIGDGTFYALPYLKRHGLIRRVKRLYGSLVGPLSPAVLRTVLAGAATIVIGACAPAGGEDAPKADNPSFAAAVPSAFGVGQAYQFAAPAFADLDGDGDADLFVGEGSGEGSGDGILYYKNEGSATAPSFTLQAGGYTGLPNVSSNRRLVPIFAPVDGDADFDAFVGEMRYDAQLTYYRKDPSGFTSQELPTGLVLSGGPDYARSATFADIDGDGDLDAFVSRTDSSYDSLITYFENTGSASDPAFTDRATSLGLGVTSDYGPAFPTFVDIDADGDFDAFVGDEDGNILFFRNTGTSASPSFAAAQPNQFGIAAVSNGPAVPAFVDIDADGDFDLFVGDDMGYIWFFENTNF